VGLLSGSSSEEEKDKEEEVEDITDFDQGLPLFSYSNCGILSCTQCCGSGSVSFWYGNLYPPIRIKKKIRIRIKVMSWIRNRIRIRINLQMTSQCVPIEYEPILEPFQGFEPLFRSRIWIRIRIRVKVGSASNKNQNTHPFSDPHQGDGKSNPDPHQRDADPQRCLYSYQVAESWMRSSRAWMRSTRV
jgi:hypothetical protein